MVYSEKQLKGAVTPCTPDATVVASRRNSYTERDKQV